MSVAAGPPLTAAQAEQLEAVPRSFRLVPAGPHARLTETVLRYDSAASAPHDPLWCAASGTEPVVRWTLRLRRSAAGFTAVLQARYREAGRDVTLAWVADNWQFHTAGGFRPESAADALPGLVLSPA